MQTTTFCTVSVFSSTVSGAPYSVGEWLGELAIYGAYVLGGWAGLALLRAVLVAVGAFFITRVALRAAPAPFAIAVAAIALALSEITWTDRPQLFTFALFPLVLELLIVARAGREIVVTVPAEEQIGPIGANQRIVTGVTIHHVIS